MKNSLNSQVGMLGYMFLWLVANLKQGVIYFIKQVLPPNISAGSVHISLSGARTHESTSSGQKFFICFLVQMKTAKSPFEIN